MRNILLGICKRRKNDLCEICHLSNRLIVLLGYSRNEIKHLFQNSYLELVVLQDRVHLQEELQHVEPEKEFSIEYGLCAQDGTVIQVRETGELIQENGEWYFYGELMDLSSFFALNGFHQVVLDALPLPLFLTDEHGYLNFVNREMALLANVTPQEMVGKPCSIFRLEACGTARCGIDKLRKDERTDAIANYSDQKYQMVTTRLTSHGEKAPNGYLCVGTQYQDQQKILQHLQDMYRRYFAAALQTHDIIWEYDHANDLLSCFLPGRREPYIVDPETLIAKRRIHTNSVADFLNLYHQVQKGESCDGQALEIKDNSDAFQWINVSFAVQKRENEALEKTVGVAREITEQKTAQMQRMQDREYRVSVMFGAMFYYEVNLTANQLTHSDHPEDLAKQQRYTSLLRKAQQEIPNEEDQKRLQERIGRKELLEAFARGEREVSVEYQRIDQSGQLIWVSTQVNLVENVSNGDIYAFIHVKDIDIQKREELQLRNKAERDALTGLYNREAAQNKINELLSESSSTFNALLMLDIDNFKLVNDLFGHVYGDAVLSELSQRLLKIVRDNDIVCRIGGDEVCVFLYDMKGGESVACKKAQEICTALNVCYTAKEAHCEVSCSVGVAFAPRDGSNFAELYEKADTALYYAKNKGKNQYVIFENELSTAMKINQRTLIERESSKIFAKSIPEYVFKILYHSTNLDFTIIAVLELLAKHYHTQHGYLYEYLGEDKGFVCGYEWWEEGNSLRVDVSTHADKIFPAEYWNHFEKDELFSHIFSKTDALQNSKLPQVRSTMQCALRLQDAFQGFIGVDDLLCARSFTNEDSNNMRVCVQIIGTFISGKRQEDKQAEAVSSLKQVLDHLEHFVYVVDEKTWELLFVNEAMQRQFSQDWQGSFCHQRLFELQQPCENCIIFRLQKEETIEKQLMRHALTGKWYEVSATRLPWPDGRKACLIECVDVSKYQ